jgi:hypothetical protein
MESSFCNAWITGASFNASGRVPKITRMRGNANLPVPIRSARGSGGVIVPELPARSRGVALRTCAGWALFSARARTKKRKIKRRITSRKRIKSKILSNSRKKLLLVLSYS